MSEAKQVTVTIDGQEVTVPEGLPLIEAAKRVGKEIPHFCYHSHLSIPANCRMCATEVEGARGLPMSCATPCRDGMVARTDTEKVINHRKFVMEFLLINHPIDCPICDQAGECMLQIYYMDHDLQASRLDVDKVEYGKRIPIGPRVVLDQERCVECTRCIRFCDEVSKTGELRMANRGDHVVISTFPGKPLDNDYSVNTADICPVGALTQKDFRFTVRAWFLKSTETICPGCSQGCNVLLDYGHHGIVKDYEGKAYRLRPRVNDDVNQAWMCDFGRVEYHRVNDDRLLLGRIGDRRTEIDEAVEAARSRFHAANRILIVTSLEATLEEMLALKALAGEAQGEVEVIAVPDRADGKSDDFLIRADKHPNRKGAEWLGLLRETAELPGLLKGRDLVLLHRVDALALDTDESIAAALREVPERLVVSATENGSYELATCALPATSYAEKDGHWVNCHGRVQRIRRGRHMKIRAGARDDVALIAGLASGELPATPREVFTAFHGTVPQLAELSWESAGKLGVQPESEVQGAEA